MRKTGSVEDQIREIGAHHIAAISAAIVSADAASVMHAAAAMSFRLSMGLAP